MCSLRNVPFNVVVGAECPLAETLGKSEDFGSVLGPAERGRIVVAGFDLLLGSGFALGR